MMKFQQNSCRLSSKSIACGTSSMERSQKLIHADLRKRDAAPRAARTQVHGLIRSRRARQAIRCREDDQVRVCRWRSRFRRSDALSAADWNFQRSGFQLFHRCQRSRWNTTVHTSSIASKTCGSPEGAQPVQAFNDELKNHSLVSANCLMCSSLANAHGESCPASTNQIPQWPHMKRIPARPMSFVVPSPLSRDRSARDAA